MKSMKRARGKGQGASELRPVHSPLAPRPSPLHFVRYLCGSACICGIYIAMAGCADDKSQSPTTRPMTMQEKQDAMLKDPMGYKTSTDKYDISGGKIDEFDKNAFKKDVDNVLNP